MTTRKRVAPDLNRLDRVVADARKARDQREQGYRGQALKLYPWICGRCAREFQQANLHELTVHHKNHNHDDNPADGSNWELLCLYCHDNEHQRQLENSGSASLREEGRATGATHSPFADLASLLRRDE
jgi:uncharacterized metal-binding protein YceD (DUF177 family)